MDCSPSGSSLRGILQPRILGRVARPPPGALPDPGTEPAALLSQSPALAGEFLTISATWETRNIVEIQ